MALSDKDIIITPNKSQTADPKIEFRGADSSTGAQTITVKAYPTNGGTLSFEGSSGQLFAVTNSLTGTLFSVNDISGVPSIEVLDTGFVKLAQYGGTVGIGVSTSAYTDKLQIANADSTGIRFTGSNATITSNYNLIGLASNNLYLRPGSGYSVIIDSGTGLYVSSGNITWASGSQNNGNPRSLAIGYSGGNYGQTGYGITFTGTSGLHNYAINDIVSLWEAYDGIKVYAAAAGTVGTGITWTTVLDARRSNSALTFKGNTVLDSSNYSTYASPLAGSASITTVGTIGSGTWQGSVIGSTYGGTGVNNGGRTLTISTNSGTIAFSTASTTLTVANTASVSGTNTGDQTTISGNAATATKWQTARTLTLGNVGRALDGSADLTWTTSELGALSNSTSSTQDGYFGDIYLYDDSTPSHHLRITNSGNLTASNRVLSIDVNDAARTVSLSGNLTVSANATISGTNTGDQTTVSGNAGTATTWQTARTLTIGATGKSVDGSANVSWSASEIGTSANTASTIVARDASGNFSAGQITGTSFLKNSITVPGVFVQAGSTGAPSAIQNGDLWWNTETGKLKIWYGTSSAWVDATSVPDLANYFPVAGGNITGNVSIGGLLNTTGNITARNGQTHSLSMGHHPSYGTSWAGVWRTGSDYALITNSSDTLVNAPTGSVGFRVANTQYAHVATDGVHTSYWFRNDANNTGLYNTTTFLHLSSTGANTSYLDISTVGSTNSGIRFYTGGHVNTLRGYIVANTSNELMLWNAGGSYSARFTSSVSEIYQDTYVPTLYANIMYRRGDTGYYLDPAATESGKMKYSFTINGVGSAAGYGLALYPAYNTAGNLEPTYGMMFASSSTFGAHGAVATGDWATYFTMSNTDSRGWIFRKVGSGNVASISGSGRMRVQSLGVNSDPSATAGTIVTSGAITAGSFVKSGGAANEILKADGFVELESNYVKINNTQTISGLKTFSSQVNLSDSLFFDNFGLTTGIYFRSSNTNRLVIWYSNNTAVIAAGTGVDVTIGATNPIRIKSATGAIECASSVTATSFIKSSGTSSQFLKADGSVDSSTYLTTAVTSLTGTANQVTVSASTGSVTLSLPQSINTGASIQFGSLGVGTAASGTTGEIRATNNITAYYSDDRLKTKLGAIENPIEKVKSLSGFYFEANETAVALGYQKKREVGVSAQEVQAILPEIIAPAPIDDKYMTVRYEKLIPLLIEAIKAQQVQIEELQKLIKEKV